MNRVKYYFLALAVMAVGKIYAHPGGHGGGPQLVADCKVSKDCTSDEIKAGATKVFNFLNDSYRLPVEWKEVKEPIWTKKMAMEKEMAWLTAFENPKPASPKDKNLYIVVSEDGFLMGVTDDISKFSEIKDYKWILGLALIAVVSGLALFIIRKLEKKTVV